MIPLVALTYGSFGDIMETARLSKRVIDVLRSGGGSLKHQKVISDLKAMHDDVVALSTAFDGDSPTRLQYFSDRLAAELALCRSLMERFYEKIKPSSSVITKIWMIVSEEQELKAWRTDIAERRQVLHLLLAELNGVLACKVGEQLEGIGSQIQYVGSSVQRVDTRVQNLGLDVRSCGLLTVLGLVSTHYMADQVSRVESNVQEIGSSVRQVIEKMIPHGISDPVFFVMDPLGRAITIQLSHCEAFNDLDRILKASLHGRRQAGSEYVERGDYSIVSAKGAIIRPSVFAGMVKAGSRFDMSIIKQRRDYVWPSYRKCPHCEHQSDHNRVIEDGWVCCSNASCGRKYQVYDIIESKKVDSAPHESSLHQDRREMREMFRLVQIELLCDQQSQQQEEYQTFFCRALYDYKAQKKASNLSFRQNDIMEVLTQRPTGWWDVLLGNERGWIPSNYVTSISDKEAPPS
ncbi:hypothetical protein MVEN_02354400 [Mycena venus]|uniref:SH3 domain-containing protein n=1 Tax=Mycena venus TaxID=2733690 RepID=A0A8H7CEV4_9AGAR|nr:hypothetical protein MVEN_02354400 [Mycena venus]